MALTHARQGQPIDLKPLGAALATATTHAILKTETLELVRLVLRAGQRLPAHRVVGEITLQCIEGLVDLSAGDAKLSLAPGQLVLLPSGQVHALAAVQDASLLLTIQIPPGAPGSASSTS